MLIDITVILQGFIILVVMEVALRVIDNNTNKLFI